MAMRAIYRPGNYHCRGFTLIELMIAMVIFAVAMTAIYTSYLTQQKTYLAQTEVAAMQQNLRAGMYLMERELRMAGYDRHRTADTGITVANNNGFQFTADLNDNGRLDANETYVYALSSSNVTRAVGGGGAQLLARNIEVLDLVYLDEDNNPLNPGLTNVSSSDLESIRSIQVTMVARTNKTDRDYKNNTVYRNQQGVVILPAPNDHNRRRILSSTVRCRNLGL